MGKVDNNKHIVNSSDGKSGRSGLNVMLRLIGLVKPLAGYMAVAIYMERNLQSGWRIISAGNCALKACRRCVTAFCMTGSWSQTFIRHDF